MAPACLKVNKGESRSKPRQGSKGAGIGNRPVSENCDEQVVFSGAFPWCGAVFVFCFPKTYSWGLLAGAGDVRSCDGDGDHARDEPRRVLTSMQYCAAVPVLPAVHVFPQRCGSCGENCMVRGGATTCSVVDVRCCGVLREELRIALQ